METRRRNLLMTFILLVCLAIVGSAVITTLTGCYLPQDCYCPQGAEVCEWVPFRRPGYPWQGQMRMVCHCRVQKVCYTPAIENDPFSGRY